MFNHCMFVGHLTRNPELRYAASGTAITSCGVACNRRFRQGEDLKEEVLFLDVVVFGKMAEAFAQYTAKGHPVILRGRLSQRRWENQDGTKQSKHELVVEEWKTLKRQDSTGNGPPQEDHGTQHPDQAPYE